MNLVELDRALRQLRLSGMAAVLETRLRQAQTEKVTPIDLVSMLSSLMNCCGDKTGCSSDAINWRAFVITIARSILSISISTRR